MKGKYKEEQKIEILDIIFNDKKLKPPADHNLYQFQKDNAKNFDYASLFLLALDNQHHDMVDYFLNNNNLSKKFSLPKNADTIILQTLNNKNQTLLDTLTENKVLETNNMRKKKI